MSEKKKILVSHLENDANNTCDVGFDILTTFYWQVQEDISHQIGRKINQGWPFWQVCKTIDDIIPQWGHNK